MNFGVIFFVLAIFSIVLDFENIDLFPHSMALFSIAAVLISLGIKAKNKPQLYEKPAL